MASFKEKLRKSGQSVLDERAQNLYELTKIEEENFLRDCKTKVLRIKSEISQHNDVAIKSRDSLVPGGKNFDSKAWVEKRHELARRLRIALIEYQLALKVDEEEFPKDEDSEISFEDIIDPVSEPEVSE